jgi:C1A family cysteine protease
MVIVSWDEDRQAFEIRNSWGNTWGLNGYCWMSKDYITNSQTQDLWAPTI